MKRDLLMDAVIKARLEKEENLKKYFSELSVYKTHKLKLQYPTFFVPGWTSENSATWLQPYTPKIKDRYFELHYGQYYRPISDWISEIIDNKEDAHYIIFSEEETSASMDFIALGQHLKRKVIEIAGDQPINLVGHSMGGLDIRAAILDDKEPRLNVRNVITLGTPNNGVGEGGLFNFEKIRLLVHKLKGMSYYHIAQCRSMYSKGPFIQNINTLENRIKLLDLVDKFYIFMGLSDMVVKGSPKLNVDGINEEKRFKVKETQIQLAEHSGRIEITQDSRVLSPLLHVLNGEELKDEYNHGIFMKGIFKP